MKALVTAGGRGTRLRPMTHTQNKHLIPIANTPILFYALENIHAAGIRDVGIIVTPESADEVRSAVSTAFKGKLAIEYIPQAAPRGLADCVKIARGFLGNDPFVFYLGDNMIVGGIRRFIDRFNEGHCNCFLTLARVPHPERFGVPELRDGKIARVVEKPANPASPFAVAGIYIYDSTIYSAVDALKPSARGEYEISDAHQYLIDHGAAIGFDEITGWWKDTGTPDDLLEANRFVLEHIAPENNGTVDAATEIAGVAKIGAGTTITRSRIRGPVIIGMDCVIEDAYIGPNTAIGNGSRIAGSEVEYSILLDRCTIDHVNMRIEGSIFGFDSVIIQAQGKPRVHRFMVGDQSRIEIV